MYTIMFIILFHQCISQQMFVYECDIETLCTISLCNLNTTYHFLGRRQTSYFLKFSNSQFKSTPIYSYCS
jgi:hypothetical protein